MATILVIDDEPTIRLLVRLSLEPHGYRALEAGEGLEGLALASQERPDLVLLDMALPRMSGLEVARQLDPSTPVLLLTGLAPDLDPESGPANILGFIEKPFNPATLANRIAETLQAMAPLPAA
jgi:CheY-like chemotaxis protein